MSPFTRRRTSRQNELRTATTAAVSSPLRSSHHTRRGGETLIIGLDVLLQELHVGELRLLPSCVFGLGVDVVGCCVVAMETGAGQVMCACACACACATRNLAISQANHWTLLG